MIERHFFAGDTQLKARGRFFRYAASSAGLSGLDERLTVVVDGMKAGVLLPGESIELDEPADRWELFPASAAPGEVEVGMGIVRSARALGMVETWPADVRRAMTGRYFWNVGSRTPGAGLYAVHGIVADGGPLAVRAFRVGAGSTGTGFLWRASGVPDVFTALQGCWPKVLMGAQSARAFMLQADSTINGGTPPAWGASTMSGWQALGPIRVYSDVRDMLQTVPVILQSGEGLYYVTQAAGVQGALEVEVEEL